MKQWLSVLACAMLLAGCAGSGKGGTEAVVQIAQDPSTGGRSIAFEPQALECERQLHCPSLAVRWHSDKPNRAVLWVGLSGGAPAVEEVVFHARPHAPLRIRSKSSQAAARPHMTAFDVPMDTLERIAFSKGTWVEIVAGGKTYREDMATGEKRSDADSALKRLMVEAYKGTDKEVSLSLMDMFAQPEQR